MLPGTRMTTEIDSLGKGREENRPLGNKEAPAHQWSCGWKRKPLNQLSLAVFNHNQEIK